MDLVELAAVRSAAAVLDGVAVRTPVVSVELADHAGATEASSGAADAGGRLWLKLENQQPIGAFKVRGAYHAIVKLPEASRWRGVVTHSSGNHGRALAYAAHAYGIPAVVVMPDDSVPLKIERVRELGAEVVLVPAVDRLATAESLAAERGLSFVPPYDHRDVIAGQGTVGLEIVEQLPEVAAVLVPVGGGGLIAGVATAVKALRPDVAVIGVEPELAADARDSLRAGHLVEWPVERRGRTVADGVRAQLSELTLAHIMARVDDIVTVAEHQIRDAITRLLRTTGVVAEPSGALATAGYLAHRDELPGGPVVAVVSGGNIDPALLAEFTR